MDGLPCTQAFQSSRPVTRATSLQHRHNEETGCFVMQNVVPPVRLLGPGGAGLPPKSFVVAFEQAAAGRACSLWGSRAPSALESPYQFAAGCTGGAAWYTCGMVGEHVPITVLGALLGGPRRLAWQRFKECYR